MGTGTITLMKNEPEPEYRDYFVILTWALTLLTIALINRN